MDGFVLPVGMVWNYIGKTAMELYGCSQIRSIAKNKTMNV